MARQVRTTCNRDCPDSCGVLVTVDERGRVVEHRGDPEHGITRGFLCQRGNRYLRRFYSPERILHPQRRTRGGWQRIGWDEALERAADELCHYRDAYGPQAVLTVSYSGIKGLVARLFGRLFWGHFGGGTKTRGGISVEAVHVAQHLDFGGDCTHAPEDLVNADGVVIWGKNVAVTRPHIVPFLRQARKAGAAVHVIDPVRCATARQADVHHQLRPGTDGALALAVGRLLLERSAIDEDFVANCCAGFEEYRKMVLGTSIRELAAATDLSQAQIEQLAELYASAKPLAAMVGLGVSYWQSGGAAVRLIDALSAITGNVGITGGGVHSDTDGSVGLDLSAFKRAPKGKTRDLLLPRLGDEILEATNPPVKMGWVAGANPAATCPDTTRVREALASLEFLVVVDQFMTATAEQADLFLPCATYLEMDDLVAAFGHHWLGVTQRAVPPRGEARSDCEILRGLAERLGFGEALAGEPRQLVDQLLGELVDHGITFDALTERARRNPLCKPVAFAAGKFATPSGRCELVTDLQFAPPAALRDPELFLVATKTLKMVNAQINTEDLADEPTVRVHPDTLRQRGLADADRAWVTSAVTRVQAQLKADAAVRRDVVLFNPAAWRGDRQGVNQLRNAAVADLGEAAAMHETRVRLER